MPPLPVPHPSLSVCILAKLREENSHRKFDDGNTLQFSRHWATKLSPRRASASYPDRFRIKISPFVPERCEIGGAEGPFIESLFLLSQPCAFRFFDFSCIARSCRCVGMNDGFVYHVGWKQLPLLSFWHLLSCSACQAHVSLHVCGVRFNMRHTSETSVLNEGRRTDEGQANISDRYQIWRFLTDGGCDVVSKCWN